MMQGEHMGLIFGVHFLNILYSLDYFSVIKDKKMLYGLELLDKIAKDDKNTILKVVDSFLKDAQLAHTYKKPK